MSDEPNDHTPQADNAAEQAVLGALMMSNDIVDEVLEIVRTEDFYRWQHQTIYAAIQAIVAGGTPADAITLANLLTERGDLKRIGGAQYLHTLLQAVPTVANAAYYARIIAEHAERRRLVEVGANIAQLGRNAAIPSVEAVARAQEALHSATVRRTTGTDMRFADLLAETFAFIDDDSPKRGLSSGLGVLDDVIGGWQPGQLILVAGRPGMGKSVCLADFARFAAMRRGEPTLLSSLEMSHREVMLRLIASEASIDLTSLIRGTLSREERARAQAKADAVRNAPLWIDNTHRADLAAIRATARRRQQRDGLGLVCIDYVQLIAPIARRTNRAEEVSEISGAIKQMAVELQCPVIVGAQLNRNPEARADKRPQLSDLRESGSLEQDADIVILLHREDYYDPESPRSGEADFIVAKHRNGPTDTVAVCAQLNFSRFVDFV